MRTISVIGIGCGDPEQITIQAIRALNRLDVIFLPDKGEEKAALREARLEVCRRYLEPGRAPRIVAIDIPARDRAPHDYRATVDDWHSRIASAWRAAIERELGDGVGGFLVWGDPSLYDSTLRILDALRADGLDFALEVAPGVAAPQALAARHAIALNRIGRPVLVTTGRRLADADLDGKDVVVMLDGEEAYSRLVDEDVEIFWGAYVGSPDEILVAGRLGDVKAEIAARRAEARARNGWIMDVYLLRARG